jgi:hypothetical protein
MDSLNETTDSCDRVPADGLRNDGVFCDRAETCGTSLGFQAGVDPYPGPACNEENDVCKGEFIPTVSEWGMVVMTPALLTTGTIVLDQIRTGTSSHVGNRVEEV